MSENIGPIKDPTVYVKLGEQFLDFLNKNYKAINKNTSDLPENLRSIKEKERNFLKTSDLLWMKEYLKNQREEEKEKLLTGKELLDEVDRIIKNDYSGFDFDSFLKEKEKKEVYLHGLMEGSELILPKNEKIKRNPVLAERIERLKREQEEREYKEMTKNVDTKRKHLPEDSVSYQMKMMNRHLIAVVQFLVSVGAGFAFGFIGLELVIGELNFGVRLLMGIAFAVIIAIAEFYFLAKHLFEEEKVEEEEAEPKPKPASKVKPKRKVHSD